MLRVEKRGQMKTFAYLLLALFVLVVVVVGVSFGWWDSFGNIRSLMNHNNIEEVVNHCKLACSDRNETLYCDSTRSPLPLSFGDGRTVDGSCAAISDVGFKDFEGISKCSLVSCSGYSDAVCKIKGKVVDCESWKLNT